MREETTTTAATAAVAVPEPSGNAAIPGETRGLALAEKIEYAKLLADSGMIPKVYQKQPANCLVAIEYGEALNLAPIVALNQITVVNGGVSMEAKLMIALARKAGHIVRLSGDAESATCTIIRADDPGHEAVVTWDKARAEKAGLWGKGYWEKDPGLMLKYRAAAQNIRLTCSEVLAGITYTPDEVEEIRARNNTPTVTVTQVRPGKPKTAGYYMKALKLSGKQFQEFAGRVLGGIPDAWEKLSAADQQKVLGALAQWEAIGADPTTGEINDAELVTDPTTADARNTPENEAQK